MRIRLSLLAGLLSLSLASPSSAANHLRWSSPYGHPDAAVNRAFACDTNVGEEQLVFSFWPPDSIEQVVGFSLVADILVPSATLPDWWQTNCRPTAFAQELTPDPAWSVAAPQGPAFGGIDLATQLPDRARLRGVGAWNEEGFGVGPATGEVFLMTLVIRHARTVAAGAIQACAGCAASACLAFNLLQLDSRAPDNSLVTHRYEGHASADQAFFATWQGGTTGFHPCPAAVPVTPSSWGRIKASYR